MGLHIAIDYSNLRAMQDDKSHNYPRFAMSDRAEEDTVSFVVVGEKMVAQGSSDATHAVVLLEFFQKLN